MILLDYLLALQIKVVRHWRRYFIESLLAIAGSLSITIVIHVFHLYPRIPNISLVYLLIVLVLASTRGLYAAVLAAFVASISFDYFLVPPLYTFTISRPEEYLALLIFLATALITGFLSARLRKYAWEARRRENEMRKLLESGSLKHAEEARRREHETHTLYELIQATNREKNLECQFDLIQQAMVDAFSHYGVRNCIILLPDCYELNEKPLLETNALQSTNLVKLSYDEAKAAMYVLRHKKSVEVFEEPLIQRQKGNYLRRFFADKNVESNGANAIHCYSNLIPLMKEQEVAGVLVLHLSTENTAGFQLLAVEDSSEHPNPQIEYFWRFLDLTVSVIERARLRQENLQIESRRRFEELRSSFISAVSHDLCTPLTMIKGAASSLRQEDMSWDIKTVRRTALIIEGGADRLERLVKNVLRIACIEGGKFEPQRELYPLSTLIDDMLECVQSLLGDRKTQINVPEDLFLEVDPSLIRQVLVNIVENAVHYTPAGSPVEINAYADNGQVRMSVADRGPGIPPNDLEHIFDKFARVRSGRQRNTMYPAGTGLGLAICRGYVEAHDGRIWAENRDDGGAIFYVTLPLPIIEQPLPYIG